MVTVALALLICVFFMPELFSITPLDPGSILVMLVFMLLSYPLMIALTQLFNKVSDRFQRHGNRKVMAKKRVSSFRR
jgi:hypothetical protein